MIKDVVQLFSFHSEKKNIEVNCDFLVFADSRDEAIEVFRKFVFSSYFWCGKIDERRAHRIFNTYSSNKNSITVWPFYVDASRKNHVISPYDIDKTTEDWWEGKEWSPRCEYTDEDYD